VCGVTSSAFTEEEIKNNNNICVSVPRRAPKTLCVIVTESGVRVLVCVCVRVLVCVCVRVLVCVFVFVLVEMQMVIPQEV